MFIRAWFEFTHCQLGEIKKRANKTCSTVLEETFFRNISGRKSSSLPLRNSPANVANLMKDKFVVPPEPPTKDKWVADGFTDTCMVCKVEKFSMVCTSQ